MKQFPVLVIRDGRAEQADLTGPEVADALSAGARVECARCNDDVHHCPDLQRWAPGAERS